MHEELAARIVDARDQHRLQTIVLIAILGSLGFVPGIFVALRVALTMSALERPDNSPAYAKELAETLQFLLLLGGGMLVGTVALCTWLWVRAGRQRARAIAVAADLLANGVRYEARVVQAQRKSMTQVKIAVHVDGPIAPFSALIESRLDEAAFVNRPVVVACDRTNPASFVLVPNW